MISHYMASSMCRRAAARIRQLAEAATPGPWTARDDDNHWSLHMADWPFQILKAPKHSTPYAEYWPDEDTAVHITSWSPPPALAVADLLDRAAVEIAELTLREPAAPLPSLLSLAARTAEAFLRSQPATPDSMEEIEARLEALKAKRSAEGGGS